MNNFEQAAGEVPEDQLILVKEKFQIGTKFSVQGDDLRLSDKRFQKHFVVSGDITTIKLVTRQGESDIFVLPIISDEQRENFLAKIIYYIFLSIH